MSQPMAIQATFSDFKLIRGRKCCQLVFEIPLEGADAALVSLGGLPQPSQEAWFGIARLDTTQPKPKALSAPAQRDSDARERRAFPDLPIPAQAGIVCNEPAFWKYVHETTGERLADKTEAAVYVRKFCEVGSRTEIADNPRAKLRWELLLSDYWGWRGFAA